MGSGGTPPSWEEYVTQRMGKIDKTTIASTCAALFLHYDTGDQRNHTIPCGTLFINTAAAALQCA